LIQRFHPRRAGRIGQRRRREANTRKQAALQRPAFVQAKKDSGAKASPAPAVPAMYFAGSFNDGCQASSPFLVRAKAPSGK